MLTKKKDNDFFNQKLDILPSFCLKIKAKYSQEEHNSTIQGATIRLPDCPGQSIFGLGNHNLQKSCLTGQVQIISKLTLILSHMLQTSKIILIDYKQSTYFNFLT